jgi:hypothetical protein
LKRIIFIFVIVLFLSAYFANPLTVFEYNETDLVSLEAQASDPDGQQLIYSYSKPLNETGEWQTTYGDAGEYMVNVTVSDGELSVSEEVLIVVHRKEENPTIDTFEPPSKSLEVEEGGLLEFSIEASDVNKDELDYFWFLNGKEADKGNKFVFSPDYSQSGDYKVMAVVSDGKGNATTEWDVKVKDVDIEGILDGISNVTVSETEIVMLDLPDFESYGLSYNISEPVGNDNYWMTDYDSAGEYMVDVIVEGKGFSGKKEVRVIVENKDRPAQFDISSVYFVKENEVLRIELKATDPDNDEITFSASGLPEGSSFNDSIFEWKPSYDTVKKESVFDYALDKLRLLTKSFTVTFSAITPNGEVKKDVKVVVQDNNRPFVIEEIGDINVSEGGIVRIEPQYSDPDGDRVSFTYSGWMNKDTYKTTYDDAGEHYVKVTGTDGYHTDYRFVRIIVEDSNRKPIFSKIGDFEVEEGESLRIELKATDPDSDEVNFSVVDPPAGSILEENVFMWEPSFDFVDRENGKRSVVVNFIAGDGKDKVSESSTITVLDKNRAPEIVDTSENLIARVNKPVVFWVDAKDEDGDKLVYEWVFGAFEKYEATAVMERTFTSKGNKKVKVIVSDGIEEVEHEWDVRVV